MLVAALGSAVGMAILFVFPKAMYPTTPVGGLDRMLAITVLAIAWTDIALAALAYRHDVGATVRARSIVEPWIKSIAAFALSFVPIMVSRGDGLIIAYVLSMVGALIASLIPLVRCYGVPHGWTPDLGTAWRTAVRNIQLTAADAVEWASRRIDLAVLGAFMPAAFVGIYYAAQQVATLPAKLKTSFEPVLGPAIVRKIAANDRASIAKQVRQVTYWIIAAQLGIALALGIPGRAVMGLVGPHFTGGTATLGFLLAAEVIAAAAVVSEAALIYVARNRNMIISLIMLAMEAGLAASLILIMKDEQPAAVFPGDRAGDRAVRRAGLCLDRQVAAAGPGARRAGVRMALGPCLGDRCRGRRRRSDPAVPAAHVPAGRRSGDPDRLLRDPVDQGLHARGPGAVHDAQERGSRAARGRGRAQWRETRSAIR